MSSGLLQHAPAAGSIILRALCHPVDFFASVGPTVNELTFGLFGSSFEPQRDIGDLSGKVVLITGGNTGLGKETVLQLAHHRPSRIYLAARNETKARDAITSIQETLSEPVDIRHIPLDLASFQSIHAAAKKFSVECDRLDLLILNAGVMANPPGLTEEGFEIQLGTNYIGPFLLTKLLLPTLQKTVASAGPAPDVRIVTVSSLGHCAAPSFEVMTSTPSLLATGPFTRYAASKAANVLFASELARRYPELLSVSLHPGVIASELYNHTKAMGIILNMGVNFISLVSRTVRTGAMNQLWASGTTRENLINGGYYVPIGIRGSCRYTDDADMARKLWEWTEKGIAERS
ncbi:hypothetical protein EYZ11_010115 [Aspergillus tanneri]|uniref:Uncharacterized protein n=1 Tax=Aspergillus tanneri TaxID=1220188 RepID=A0A4S3J645_9EURO|nr:uncharacterized protein ATNIH1004_010174 [Aspergillus tanneri]KAA8643405.1 hypothetical protein ATNIH1004_010174 [Aspergillus tanneri]THC90416.1 hypothetical protein EYZ11_010115 [Aspergillus tanneri]